MAKSAQDLSMGHPYYRNYPNAIKMIARLANVYQSYGDTFVEQAAGIIYFQEKRIKYLEKTLRKIRQEAREAV